MEAPTEPEDLRDWLRELKDRSGLSFPAIAQAIGEDARNVKRWMAVDTEPKIPRGDVVLKLVSALGVTLDPAPPETVRALNAKVEELRAMLTETERLIRAAHDEAARDRLSLGRRLESLEATVAQEAKDLTEILEGLERGIEQIAARLDGEDGQATRRAKP